ncbi:nuclear localization sequence-binding protein-like [Brachypodium distachyon]|uniref:nuclear localization sequence-binding protein-like n=1 Tax=Brachypodium distachyon TaxID=15368 RepID=UPI00052FF514|nr:nuclear localization sequence-binding protein-like [Brachypodium distachyon]|eukprot:XP_010229768.1 nuclear localization sequence-binding protein-like [Brachypodium distachyon]
MTRQASKIAEVNKTAKEFGLRIKVPAGRILSEHTAQREEADQVLGKNQEDLSRPEETPTSSSLPRTKSVDASAEEGRTCDFEVEATRDLNVNDAETDADAPVPTPEVRMKKAVEKKSVAPSEPSDPSSSSDEEEEEEKKEEEKEPAQESDDLMEIDRLPEDLLKTAPKKK